MNKLSSLLKNVKLSSGFYQTCVYGFGIVLMKSVSFIMIPYVTRYLVPEEFGNLQVLNVLGDFSEVFFGFGLGAAMVRFAVTAKSHDETRRFCANSLGLVMIISFVLSPLMFFYVDDIKNLLPANVTGLQVRFVIINIMLGSINAIQLTWLRLNNKAFVFVIMTTGRAVLQAGLVAMSLAAGFGVTGILFSACVSVAVISVALITIQIRDIGISVDWQHSKVLIAYGAPLILSGMGIFTTSGLEQWWVAKVIGVADMAQYALAVKFLVLAPTLLYPFELWWGPRRFSLLKSPEDLIINGRIASMGTTLAFIVALFASFIGIIGIKLLTPESYHYASNYLPWLAVSWSIGAAVDMLNLGCYTQKTTFTPTLIILFSAIITIFSFYNVIPIYGIPGLIFCLYVNNLIKLLLFTYFSQKVLYLPYYTKKLILIFAITIIAILLGSRVDGNFSQPLVSITLIGIVCIISMKLGLIPRLEQLIIFNRGNTQS